METFRGGLLFLFRWLVHYPIVLGTYRIWGLTRAPYLTNPELMDSPGILVSNYSNYFYDDMLSLMAAPVWPFAFACARFHRIPFIRPIFWFFRNLPIVRSYDRKYPPEVRKQRNETAFEEAAELLRKGHWFSAFPELTPRHTPKLNTPLKPGAAHIAFKAEQAAGWKLGLRIYVYGVNYENKLAGRSSVYLRWAAPILVAKYREAFEQDAPAAEALLMKEIETTLHSVVIEAESMAKLAAAHRLAFYRKQRSYVGVEQALSDVGTGTSVPEELKRIACRKQESILYQVLGFALWFISSVLGWPFRVFGRLCATDRSQEMTFQFMLWVLVLIAGSLTAESRWGVVQLLSTWIAMNAWLWAWRRGLVEERDSRLTN